MFFENEYPMIFLVKEKSQVDVSSVMQEKIKLVFIILMETKKRDMAFLREPFFISRGLLKQVIYLSFINKYVLNFGKTMV